MTVIARNNVETYSVYNCGRNMSLWSIRVCLHAVTSSTSTRTLRFFLLFGSICFWFFSLGADELQMLDSDEHLDLIWRFMSSFIDFHYLFLTKPVTCSSGRLFIVTSFVMLELKHIRSVRFLPSIFTQISSGLIFTVI